MTHISAHQRTASGIRTGGQALRARSIGIMIWDSRGYRIRLSEPLSTCMLGETLSSLRCTYMRCPILVTLRTSEWLLCASVLVHISVLEITVGHRTLSDQILKMSGQFHIMISQVDRISHQHILIFFKVLSVNRLCPVQFVKCPTKRKI